MLKELRIKNFKSLKDTGDLEIKPITLLVGPNSSGKSSLIQFLLLLKQTMESRYVENPLILNGTYIQLESYQNVIYRNDVDQNLEFEFSFDPQSHLSAPILSPEVRYHVVFHGKEGKVRLVRFEILDIESKESGLSVIWNRKEKKYDIMVKFKKIYGLNSLFRVIRFYFDVIPFAGETDNPFKDKI